MLHFNLQDHTAGTGFANNCTLRPVNISLNVKQENGTTLPIIKPTFYFSTWSLARSLVYMQYKQVENTFSARSGFNAKWGWYQAIFSLAKGDLRRFENITQLKAHECLMMLEYMKEKNEIEANEIKKKYKR